MVKVKEEEQMDSYYIVDCADSMSEGEWMAYNNKLTNYTMIKLFETWIKTDNEEAEEQYDYKKYYHFPHRISI